MVRSRLLRLGVALAVVLSALVVAGAALRWWWLFAAGIAAFGSSILLVALDVDRRARSVSSSVKQLAKRRPPAPARPAAPPPAPRVEDRADLVGTVRLLQAQYVGRLDRMEARLERALTDLADGRPADDR